MIRIPIRQPVIMESKSFLFFFCVAHVVQTTPRNNSDVCSLFVFFHKQLLCVFQESCCMPLFQLKVTIVCTCLHHHLVLGCWNGVGSSYGVRILMENKQSSLYCWSSHAPFKSPCVCVKNADVGCWCYFSLWLMQTTVTSLIPQSVRWIPENDISDISVK